MGELSQQSKFERHINRAPIYIGICIFLMQMLTQFSLFFQLPEKVKIVMSRLQTIEEFMSKGQTMHAAKDEQLKALRHDVDQREQQHKLMLDDDRTQWEAIRDLDRRVDGLEKEKE